MIKAGIFAVAALLLGGASIGLGYYAGQTSGSAQVIDEPEVIAAGPSAETTQIEAIVRNYLLKNPEIMIEIQTALETKRNDESRVAQSKDRWALASSSARSIRPSWRPSLELSITMGLVSWCVVPAWRSWQPSGSWMLMS